MRFSFLLPALLLISACSTSKTASESAASIHLDDWHREEITLPPQFAPELPAGEEVLLFAPGMFDAEAEGYWSYVFLMQVHEGSMTDARLLEIFELYYDGLIAAVAEDRMEDVGKDPAKVHMQALGNGNYGMQIDLIDAFVTMKPLHLNLLVEVVPGELGGTIIRVRATPKAKEHKVWLQLNQALRSLRFES